MRKQLPFLIVPVILILLLFVGIRVPPFFSVIPFYHSSGSSRSGTSAPIVHAQAPPAALYVASGTADLNTAAIASATCDTVVTKTATGTLTTDVVQASFNSDPHAVTGYIPSTSGMLTIIIYPTADHANFLVCNNTGSSITPGAITLNWLVTR